MHSVALVAKVVCRLQEACVLMTLWQRKRAQCVQPSTHAPIHTYMCTCLYAYIYTYIYTHMHVCMYAYMHTTYRHTGLHICDTQAYVHAYMLDAGMNTYMQNYTHACVHTYMHTFIAIAVLPVIGSCSTCNWNTGMAPRNTSDDTPMMTHL